MNIDKSKLSIIETDNIGQNTNIGYFVHILPRVIVGENCEISDCVHIDNDVTVGDSVVIKSGAQLCSDLYIENDVYIGPNVIFSKQTILLNEENMDKVPRTIIKKNSSIGANATILSGITIGRNAQIKPGTVVTRDVPPNAIATGNPSYITGYVSYLSPKHLAKSEMIEKSEYNTYASHVKGVTVCKLPIIVDMRGNLSFAEYGQYLPFIPKRYFIVFDVANKEIRGEHAHRSLHQFLICVKGSCALVVDDGFCSQEINLENPSIGVHIEPMVWGIQYKYSSDAVLLVLASDVYKADDYIRDYDEFLKELKHT